MNEPQRKSTWAEYRLSGKRYTMTPRQKAAQLQISEGWLARDRLKDHPEVDFARLGRLVRYSED